MRPEHYEIARAAYDSRPFANDSPFDDLDSAEKRQWLRVGRAVVAVVASRAIPSWLENGEKWQDAVRDRLERFQ